MPCLPESNRVLESVESRASLQIIQLLPNRLYLTVSAFPTLAADLLQRRQGSYPT